MLVEEESQVGERGALVEEEEKAPMEVEKENVLMEMEEEDEGRI